MSETRCEHATPWEGGDINEESDGSARCTGCGKRWVPADVLEEAASIVRELHEEHRLAYSTGGLPHAPLSGRINELLRRIDEALGK